MSMEHYIADRSKKPLSKNDIIAINNMAKADKAKGNKVINGSIGSFLDDEKKLGAVEIINEALREHITDRLGYPSVYGDEEYLDQVNKWIFGHKKERIDSLYHVFTGATIGGTGAISVAFNLFLEPQEAVLLPDVMWTNYKLIAKKANDDVVLYNMFNKEDKFDIESVRECIEKQFEKKERVLLVINDPCQNPTGYCLDEKEYDALFDMLNEEGKKGKLTVLFDIAYLSFYAVDGHSCVLIDKLCEKKTTFLPLIAFSCSKVFGLYGMRVGALLALALDEDEYNEIHSAFGAQARGVYSVSVGAAEYAVSTVLENRDLRHRLLDEINTNRVILKERGETIVKELEKAGIKHYPYGSGFFITIKVDDAFSVFEKLKAEHIYVVPMNEKSIRIALSGMTKDEASVLVGELEKAIR